MLSSAEFLTQAEKINDDAEPGSNLFAQVKK